MFAAVCSLMLFFVCGQAEAASGVDAGQSQVLADSIAPLPPGAYAVNGRIVAISLPYRTSDNLLWVSATGVLEAAPFMFQNLDIQPRAGPQGTDLAVFTYKADKAGTAKLEFGLVPPGKTLLGKGSTRLIGEPASRYSVEVTVK